jgi:hypothetical protein
MTEKCRHTLSRTLINAAFGVPQGDFTVVYWGNRWRFGGHFTTPADAMAALAAQQEILDRAFPRRAGRQGVWLLREDKTGTLTVYTDPVTPGRTAKARPLCAEHTKGTLGDADCCTGHRKACTFGKEHRWSTWRRDGHLVRTDATLHCRYCGGVCTANEGADTLALGEVQI